MVMLPFNYPFIADEIVLGPEHQAFYNDYVGSGSVFFLARVIRYAGGLPDNSFRAQTGRQVLFFADLFEGGGLLIDASGPSPKPETQGLPGDGGTPGRHHLTGAWSPLPGGAGGTGQPGREAGRSGTPVTIMCREIRNLRVSAAGGTGSQGGQGGRGGNGVEGKIVRPGGEPEIAEGSRGGPGGSGGPGAPGGAAGKIVTISVAAPQDCAMDGSGGPGGPGGPPGPRGKDGKYALDELPGPNGSGGPAGPVGTAVAPEIYTLSEADYIAGLRPHLGAYANHWAPFRLSMGEWHYRRFHSDDGSSEGALAVVELDRALELQYDNRRANQLREQLLGLPVTDPESGRAVWTGGGLNVLGLPRNLDLLPKFQDYQEAYVQFADLSLGLFSTTVDAELSAEQQASLVHVAENQIGQAQQVASEAKRQQEISAKELTQARDEFDYRQAELARLNGEVNAALEEMEKEKMKVGGVFTTVAAVAGAVISVIGAIPSGGASLVAIVPSLMALSKSVVDSAGPIAHELFKGKQPPPTEAVSKAAQQFGKQAQDLVKAGHTIADFIDVVNKIGDGITPDNAKHAGLVKEAAVAAHALLLSQNDVAIAELRAKSAEATAGEANQLVASITDARNEISNSVVSLRQLALQSLAVALSRMDVILDAAFRAQRAVEIVTRRDETRSIAFDSGMIHPETQRRYWEGRVDGATMLRELQDAWGKLLLPATLSQHFLQVTGDAARDHDVLRLSINDPALLADFRATRTLRFMVDPAPRGRLEAKARNVAVALVGARTRTGTISSEITHGSRYEQRIGGSADLDADMLLERTSTRLTDVEPLDASLVSDAEFLHTEPDALAFWGRGVGGTWTLAVPDDEASNQKLDLTDLAEVQIWIAYQFLR
ncbi:hypothetical protein K7957_15590 [Sphingomonas yunnanensis]|uniref:hypothetical protein n=1 Tax=Sphingomonas yunnanensis TaxID=310400 RepID=UPI001CA74B7E|nr:hypothetical protein [Sphingomonas yunnanensis]MBY9064362.1 hypothetical protein [Sphingomonas yunnanensis]